MEFLESIDKLYYIIGLGIIFFIGHLIVQRKDNLKLSLQYRLVVYGIVMMILMFSLPITPTLSTFGYPEDVADIETKENLLKFLQEYNVAIVRTTEVVHYMIFITTFWLISIMFTIIKHFKIDKTVES